MSNLPFDLRFVNALHLVYPMPAWTRNDFQLDSLSLELTAQAQKLWGRMIMIHLLKNAKRTFHFSMEMNCLIPKRTCFFGFLDRNPIVVRAERFVAG